MRLSAHPGAATKIYQARGGFVVVRVVDRHCERSEAIQRIPVAIKFEPPSWIASSVRSSQ
jgi:hypothetical protein